MFRKETKKWLKSEELQRDRDSVKAAETGSNLTLVTLYSAYFTPL